MKQIRILIVDDDNVNPYGSVETLKRNILQAFSQEASFAEFEPELVVIAPGEGEVWEWNQEYIDRGLEAIQTQHFDICFFDWNVGTMTSASEQDNLYTDELILKAQEMGILFRIISGSGISLIRFFEKYRELHLEEKFFLKPYGLNDANAYGVTDIVNVLAEALGRRAKERDPEKRDDGGNSRLIK